MKRYTRSAIILLAALAFAGCSETEEFQNNPDSALQIESVSGISTFALMQEPVTRAVISGETLPTDEAAKGIGMFVTESDGGAYDGKATGYSNVKYAYSNSKWSAASPIYLSNTTGKLYGYFPYSEAATNLKAIPVESSLNGTDYLYATSQDVSFSNKSVNLQMNHALARLHLTIKKGDKYLSNCNLSKIALYSKAIDASGTMDITTGTITATKAVDATGTFTLTGSDAVTTAGITKDILLVPANSAEGKKDLTLTLTIDGVDAEVKFTADKGLDIRSGIQCNATLTIEDTGIKVTGVGVGTWGEGGSQTVQVGSHTITVKLGDDVIANDIMADVQIEEDKVVISAISKQRKNLSCNVNKTAQCQRVNDDGIYIFTITDITSDIEAVLFYTQLITLTVSTDANGKVWIGDDKSRTTGQFEMGETITIHAEPFQGYRIFKWNDNNRDSERTIIVGDNDATYSAKFLSADLIPGLFSISNNKQVFFSSGNLCYVNGNWTFESEQYEYKSSRDDNHICHFFWCKNAVESTYSKYASSGDDTDIFFANNTDFVVNGQKGWSVLEGGENKGWDYVINRPGKSKSGVNVCGKANCLILLPDDWQWDENTVGSGWQEGGYTNSSEEGKVTWRTMENAGAVCLPAAGYRNDGSPQIYNAGSKSRYWTASTGSDMFATHFSFTDKRFDTSSRQQAYAVRLVKESK